MRNLSGDELSSVSGGSVWCGPDWLAPLVVASFNSVSFENACMRHDDDFAAGSGVPMRVANERFLRNLLEAAGDNPLGVAMAMRFHQAVEAFGSFFYEGDQAPSKQVTGSVQVIFYPSDSVVVVSDDSGSEAAPQNYCSRESLEGSLVPRSRIMV